jgi:hypothetical protein
LAVVVALAALELGTALMVGGIRSAFSGKGRAKTETGLPGEVLEMSSQKTSIV